MAVTRWLVTGGASGIGAALAARLARRGALLAVDRAPAACDTLFADLSTEAGVRGAAAGAIEWLAGARLDGLALVAGLPGTAPPAAIMAVNLHAPALLAALLAPRIADGGGVVAVSSVTAHRCDWDDARLDALIDGGFGAADGADLPGATAYEVSKRALNRWVQRAAARLHPRGIRVNGVAPGPVQTPILKDFEASIGKDRLDAAARLAGRHGRPDEIAAAVEWLLAGDSGWVNGVDLKVDGGYHALRAAAS